MTSSKTKIEPPLHCPLMPAAECMPQELEQAGGLGLCGRRPGGPACSAGRVAHAVRAGAEHASTPAVGSGHTQPRRWGGWQGQAGGGRGRGG